MECPECNAPVTTIHRAHDIAEAECYQLECEQCGCYSIVEDEDGRIGQLLAQSEG